MPPWDKYAAPQPIVRVPAKPPAGFGAPGAPPVEALQGGPDDPKVIERNERIKAGIQAGKERQLTGFRTQQELMADAVKRQREQAGKNGLDPQKLANIRAVQAQIDRLNGLYKKGPGRTKGFSGVLDFLPTQKNGQFDTAAAGLGEVGLAAFRVPGVGTQTDAELRAFVDANRPSSWDRDASSTEKVRNLQNRLDQTYKAYGIKRQGSAKVIDFNDLGD